MPTSSGNSARSSGAPAAAISASSRCGLLIAPTISISAVCSSRKRCGLCVFCTLLLDDIRVPGYVHDTHIASERNIAMKAAVVQGPGRIPVYADFEAPTPDPGENLIRVTAAALTQLTRGRASGAHYSASGHFPFVAGVDGVGRLDDGTRVYFLL